VVSSSQSIRKSAFQYFLTKEVDYLQGLTLLMEKYVLPASELTRNDIFYGVPEVHEFTKKVVAEFKRIDQQWNEEIVVTQPFINFQLFRAYEKVALKAIKAMNLLNNYKFTGKYNVLLTKIDIRQVYMGLQRVSSHLPFYKLIFEEWIKITPKTLSLQHTQLQLLHGQLNEFLTLYFQSSEEGPKERFISLVKQILPSRAKYPYASAPITSQKLTLFDVCSSTGKYNRDLGNTNEVIELMIHFNAGISNTLGAVEGSVLTPKIIKSGVQLMITRTKILRIQHGGYFIPNNVHVWYVSQICWEPEPKLQNAIKLVDSHTKESVVFGFENADGLNAIRNYSYIPFCERLDRNPRPCLPSPNKNQPLGCPARRPRSPSLPGPKV
jgi:hypothetical protein